MNSVWRLCLLVIPCSLIFAEASRAGPSFSQGVKSYQENQLESAREHFQQELKDSPDNSTTIYNLGLVEYKLGRRGLGLAYWRKSLDLDPGNSRTLAAIKFATDELLTNKSLPTKPLFENLRSSVLVYMSLAPSLLFAALFLFAAIWILLTFLGSRRRAQLLGTSPMRYPLYGYMLWIFSALFLGITILKNMDLKTKRATVISSSAIMRSGPNEEATNLFELFEGTEVIVRQFKDTWTQVSLPGKNSGWVLSAQLFTSSK